MQYKKKTKQACDNKLKMYIQNYFFFFIETTLFLYKPLKLINTFFLMIFFLI